jgi:hypothetical protein
VAANLQVVVHKTKTIFAAVNFENTNLSGQRRPSIVALCGRRCGAALMLRSKRASEFMEEKSFLKMFNRTGPRCFSRLFAANQNLKP